MQSLIDRKQHFFYVVNEDGKEKQYSGDWHNEIEFVIFSQQHNLQVEYAGRITALVQPDREAVSLVDMVTCSDSGVDYHNVAEMYGGNLLLPDGEPIRKHPLDGGEKCN